MYSKKVDQAVSGRKGKTLLQDAIAIFLEQYGEASAKSYGSNLKIISNLIGPGREIEDITHMDMLRVQKYINDKDRDYAIPTRAKYIKTLKVFFNWLVRYGFLDESPSSFLRVPKVDPYVDPQKAMTDQELEKLLDYVRWKPRDLALVLFLADSAARAGGAAGLKWSDISWEERRAEVTEKGNRTGPVAFGDLCAGALKRWYERRPETAGEYVFSPKKTKMQPACISQVVTRACVRAGIRPLGSHSLRHRKGHQFAEQRIAPTIAALAMRHLNSDVTLGSYYPRGWARTDEILKDLAVKSLTSPGAQPPEPPMVPPDREEHNSKIIRVNFKRPS